MEPSFLFTPTTELVVSPLDDICSTAEKKNCFILMFHPNRLTDFNIESGGGVWCQNGSGVAVAVPKSQRVKMGFTKVFGWLVKTSITVTIVGIGLAWQYSTLAARAMAVSKKVDGLERRVLADAQDKHVALTAQIRKVRAALAKMDSRHSKSLDGLKQRTQAIFDVTKGTSVSVTRLLDAVEGVSDQEPGRTTTTATVAPTMVEGKSSNFLGGLWRQPWSSLHP